jgi:hypothetical protein
MLGNMTLGYDVEVILTEQIQSNTQITMCSS